MKNYTKKYITAEDDDGNISTIYLTLGEVEILLQFYFDLGGDVPITEEDADKIKMTIEATKVMLEELLNKMKQSIANR